MALVTQKISNSKKIATVERELDVLGINLNSDAEEFNIFYRINYLQNKEDISAMFNAFTPDWKVTNNQKIRVRDENFQYILNPEFEEVLNEEGEVANEEERYVTMNGFDYVKMLMFDYNVPLKAVMQGYIAEADAEGRFD